MKNSVIELLQAAENEAYRGLYSVLGYQVTTIDCDNLYITTAQNAFAEKALLAWSYLFGSKTAQYNKNYQIDVRHVFSDPAIKAIHSKFSSKLVYGRIVNSTGLNATDYQSYRDNMKKVRDGFLAHKDMNASPDMPDLDVALKMFQALRDELSCLFWRAHAIYPHNSEIVRMSNYYQWNANHMIENQFRKSVNQSVIAVEMPNKKLQSTFYALADLRTRCARIIAQICQRIKRD